MKLSERRWITAFLLLTMAFLSSIFAVQGSLLSHMIDRFQLDAASQGLANTTAFVGGILALVLAFALQGRWKKRTLVKASSLLCALGLVLMWLAPAYWVFVLAWFITGFGLGLLDTLLSACMADLYTGKQAVTMMCILHMTFGMASMLSPMAYAALLASGVTGQTIYLLVACAGTAIVLVAQAMKKALRIVDRESLSQQALDVKSILPAMKQGRLLLLLGAIFFHGIFLSGLNTWSNRYADLLGTSIALPAQSCVFLGIMTSRLVMPFLPIDSKKYVAWGGILGGAVLGVGLLVPNGLVLRIALVVSSLLFGALIPCILSLGCDRQKDNTLLATTGIMLFLYLGQSVSAPLISALEAAVSLRAGIFLCAGSMIACSLLCALDSAQRKE